MQHIAVDGGMFQSGAIQANTMTIVNTNILFTSGLCVMYITAVSGRRGISHHTWPYVVLLCIVGMFLTIQCGEYIGLYWSLPSGGVGMMFYALTGLHGSHVLLGASLFAGIALVTGLSRVHTHTHLAEPGSSASRRQLWGNPLSSISYYLTCATCLLAGGCSVGADSDNSSLPGLSTIGLYWHFVDGVWVCVLLSLYIGS